MELKRVVITGLGALTPIGNTVQVYWENLLNGVSGSDMIRRFDASPFKTQIACELKDFDIGSHMSKKEIRRNDTFTQYGLIVAEEALNDANVKLDKVNRERIGVIWATGFGGIGTAEEQITKHAQNGDTPRFSAMYIPKMLVDSSSGAISMRYGLLGVNYNTSSACASSNNALIDAFNLIRLGKADMILAGGSEAAITPSILGGFSSAQALSTRNGDPKTASRPFDVGRDGFVMGEGAGVLVVEEYEHAVRRGAKIYAEFIGGGSSADAYHATAAHPEGRGARLSMRSALEDAQIEPNQIDHMNPHATSTPVGDGSEMIALQAIMGEHLTNISISATKSMTGHLLGAAGAIEAVATVLAVTTDTVPPTVHTEQVDPVVPASVNLTLGTKRHHSVNIAMSNSFGFGGHNATVIFRKAPEV